jgi:Zn-dependent protease with chaperone function
MQTTEARRAKVEALEALARRRPRAYRARVTALALIGLGYRVLIGFAFVAVPTALTFAFYPATWIFVIGVVLLLLFGLTWFGRIAIEGRRIHAARAPQLFDALEALRRRIRAPRVHEVVLTQEFNASAAQIPRLGIFGWHKQVLTLGIPLMAALSRAQLLAVIGHELGHFSKAHGRMGHWVYRIRASWEKLHRELGEEDSGIGAAVNQFYRWFVPYFSLYSFALARLDEYEADADAVLATDGPNAGGALTALHAFGSYLDEEYWPQLWKGALEEREPPQDAFARLAEAVKRVPRETLSVRQREALERTSDLVDTHPCLTDRLAAFRAGEIQLVAPAVSAGEAFLGERWSEALREAGKEWQSANAQAWREQHERLAVHAQRFAELGARPESALSRDERIELARLVQRVEGPRASLERWQALHSQAPDDARILFRYGKALAALRERQAFDLLDRLARQDAGYATAALEAMKRLALDLGDKARADAFDTRRQAAERGDAAAAKGFETALIEAHLEAHGLPDHLIRVLARQLKADGAIATAYLARLPGRGDAAFHGYLLVLRIEPEAMNRRNVTHLDLCGRALGLATDLLEPCALVWVRNYYTTEDMDEKVAAALQAVSSKLFGT